MAGTVLLYDPTAPRAETAQQADRILTALAGKVVGFIDNAKPNFNYLVDDLGELLKSRYKVAEVIKHRKPGQVPVEEAVLKDMAERCDAVITGSGD